MAEKLSLCIYHHLKNNMLLTFYFSNSSRAAKRITRNQSMKILTGKQKVMVPWSFCIMLYSFHWINCGNLL